MQNHLTADILAQIEDYAGCFMTPHNIATIVELPADQFLVDCADTSTPIGRAYCTGRLISEAKLHKSILALANAGSSPAQAMALELLKKQQLNESDHA